MGHVMQRGPPLPRPSSLLGTVMTSIPALRSIVLVVTFRSYPITTPGATARKFVPSSHCSRSAARRSSSAESSRILSTSRAAAIAYHRSGNLSVTQEPSPDGVNLQDRSAGSM